MVTGAASGIGRSTAKLLALEGANLILVDKESKGLDATRRAVNRPGSIVHTVTVDLTEDEEVGRILGNAIETQDHLDALINAHGISHASDTTIEKVSAKIFDQTLAANLRSVFLTCKLAIPGMKSSGGGAIVNVSSIGSLRGGGGLSYATSKGGINAMTRAIAHELAQYNIRCNTVCPGPTETPLLQSVMQKRRAKNLPEQPGTISRAAQADEVASLIAYLCSDRAAYITGATYVIDGGRTGH